MNREPLAVRLSRRTVRWYPRAFRDEYGADIVELVARQCADEPSGRVLGRTIADLITTVPRQHLENVMHRPPAHLATLAPLTLSAAGLVVAFLGGTNGPVVASGLAVFVVGLVLGAITMRSTPWQHSPADRGRGWWQLLLAGPVIVAAVLLAAQAGVEAWFVGMVCVLLAIGLTALGVGLGVVRLLTRRQLGGSGALSA